MRPIMSGNTAANPILHRITAGAVYARIDKLVPMPCSLPAAGASGPPAMRYNLRISATPECPDHHDCPGRILLS